MFVITNSGPIKYLFRRVPTAVTAQVVDEPMSFGLVQARRPKNFKSNYAADAGGRNNIFLHQFVQPAQVAALV